MPCDYSKYPKDWKEIVKREKIRAGNRCEMCGVPNGMIIGWDSTGQWFNKEFNSGTKVVLTVHHIDSDKTNNKYPNLLVVCQKHHLRLDLGKHMKNAKETRNKKKEAR